jgi:hypothetical protein
MLPLPTTEWPLLTFTVFSTAPLNRSPANGRKQVICEQESNLRQAESESRGSSLTQGTPQSKTKAGDLA